MLIKNLQVGPLGTNCYIIACEETKKAAVIDPGDEGERILDFLNKENLELQYIINTHAHWDHIGANDVLKDKTAAELVIHEQDAAALQQGEKNLSIYFGNPESSPAADKIVVEGDKITIGNIELKVLNTPGHTDGSICLYDDKNLFSGDTIFAGSIGRTDLPGGSYEKIVKSIQEKLTSFEDDINVYPGHGPQTTIAAERKMNPFF